MLEHKHDEGDGEHASKLSNLLTHQLWYGDYLRTGKKSVVLELAV